MRRFLAGLLALLTIACSGPAAAQSRALPVLLGSHGPQLHQGLVVTRQGIPPGQNPGNQAAIGDFQTKTTTAMRNGVVIYLANFMIQAGTPNETGPGQASTFACAFLWNGIDVGDCKFAGADTVVAADNTYVKTDPLNLKLTIPAGSAITIRIMETTGTGLFPEFNLQTGGTDVECVGTTASISAHVSIVHSATTLTSANTGAGVCVNDRVVPVMAVTAPTTGNSSVIFGDSISAGATDTFAPSMRMGVVARGYDDFHPFLNLSSGGSTAACIRYNTNGNGDCAINGAANMATNRLKFIGEGLASTLVTQLGTNDFHVIGGTAVTNLEANLAWIWQQAPNHPKIIQTTITPKTGSSDSFATLVNQTASDCTPTCATSTYAVFNNHVRAKTIPGQGDFWDILQGVDATHRIMNDPTTPDNLWAVNGSAFFCAIDTINHPTPACYAFAALNIDLRKIQFFPPLLLLAARRRRPANDNSRDAGRLAA